MNSLSPLLSVALSLGIAVAPKAAAVEPRESVPLQLKPKSAIAASAPSRNYAPFVRAASPAPELDLLPRNTLRRDRPNRSSCESGGTLCYNPASGQIDFQPARSLMPDLPGLTRESISVNRHRIILRYSF
jgi:hypothetical protein